MHEETNIIVILAVFWLLWPLWRVYLTMSPSYKFGWDYTNHGDVGWPMLALGLALSFHLVGRLMVVFGIILVVDDTIGHWKAARGGKEEFVLEPILNWLLKIFGSSFIKLWRWVNGK